MSDTLQEPEDQFTTPTGECGNTECACHELARGAQASQHEPAARGGGERIRVELINGVEGQCIGVNDYRICGPKPYGGGSIAKSWTTDKNDVLRAFLTPDEKHAWLADDLQVVSMKQHHSLVAEREQMLDALKGVAVMLNTQLEKYDKEPWAQRVRAAIVTGEQRSTSE